MKNFGSATASQVQNAIWYAESEYSASLSDYELLKAFDPTSIFAVTGWNIQAVNIVDPDSGAFRQSQLVVEQLPYQNLQL